MNKKILIVALACCSTGIKAEKLIETTEATVVGIHDLSGDELWHGYFSPDNIVLVEPAQANHQEAIYINHPVYQEQVDIVHRLVCNTGGVNGGLDGDDIIKPCTDDFGHVHGLEFEIGFRASRNTPVHPHLSDYELASQYADRKCNAYGFRAFPVYHRPASFVYVNDDPNTSHYFLYNLTQGLSFDCVLPEM